MRGPFDTTCDIVAGPYAAVPGVVRVAAVPCRLVQDNTIVTVGPWQKPFLNEVAYITMDVDYPATFHAPLVAPGQYALDFTGMEMLVLPSGGATIYYPLLVERVTPSSGTPYWRCYVATGSP